MSAVMLSADAEGVARAAALLRAGGVVAIPTETVYGLAASAVDAAAVAKIFAAKGRPSTDPLIVHLASVETLSGVAAAVPPIARVLAAAFWPGPLTLIVPRGEAVPLSVTAGRETVAVRVPAHPVAHAILMAAGIPLAAPSANRFSRPSPTTAAHVADDLGDRIDAIVDAGPTVHGVESTIVDTTTVPPTLRRPGAVSLERLRAVVPTLTVSEPAHGQADAAQVAPGQLLKHYSPRAEVRLWSGTADVARAAMRADAERWRAVGKRVGALIVDDDRAWLPDDVVVASLGALGASSETGALAEVAARLFSGLRALDAAGVDVIVTRDLGRGGLGLAIWDRLYRAAEGRVLDSAKG